MQLGANHCPLKSSPDASPRGMAWCDASILEAPGANRSSREAVTGSFDTSVMYALNGHVDADDGEHIYLCAAKSHRSDLARTRLHACVTSTRTRRYYLAGTLSHGAYADGAPLNSNLMLLQLRKDGWTSLEADYVFNRPLEQLPQVTTTAQRVPRCPGAVELLLNAVTGVAGYVLVGVRGQALCALLADLADGGTIGSAL